MRMSLMYDDTLACRYAAGDDASLLLNRMLIGDVGPSGWVSRHRRTLIRSGPGETCRDAAPGTIVESALVCPLIVNHQFIGTLGLYHVERVRYTEDHRRLLERARQGAAMRPAAMSEPATTAAVPQRANPTRKRQ